LAYDFLIDKSVSVSHSFEHFITCLDYTNCLPHWALL